MKYTKLDIYRKRLRKLRKSLRARGGHRLCAEITALIGEIPVHKVHSAGSLPLITHALADTDELTTEGVYKALLPYSDVLDNADFMTLMWQVTHFAWAEEDNAFGSMETVPKKVLASSMPRTYAVLPPSSVLEWQAPQFWSSPSIALEPSSGMTFSICLESTWRACRERSKRTGSMPASGALESWQEWQDAGEGVPAFFAWQSMQKACHASFIFSLDLLSGMMVREIISEIRNFLPRKSSSPRA